MTFKRYALGRAIMGVAQVFAVAIISYVVLRLAPGNPAYMLCGATCPPDYLHTVEVEYGLDQPAINQFVQYFTLLLHGNLGVSISYGRPVLDVILDRLPQTILLVGTAILFSIIFGILFGIFSARKAYSKRDHATYILATLFYSSPVYVTGLLFILVFSIWFHIFPSGSMYTPESTANIFTWVQSILWHLVLPAGTLFLFFVASYTLVSRASLIDAMGQNYVTMARAKGVPERRILFRHALRNSLLPIITIAGVQIGQMVVGAILTEGIYSWPGVGSLLIQAVQGRDYPLVTGILLIVATTVAIANFVADMLYSVADPRIRQ